MRRIKLTGRFLHEHEVFVGACCAWCGQLLWRWWRCDGGLWLLQDLVLRLQTRHMKTQTGRSQDSWCSRRL